MSRGRDVSCPGLIHLRLLVQTSLPFIGADRAKGILETISGGCVSRWLRLSRDLRNAALAPGALPLRRATRRRFPLDLVPHLALCRSATFDLCAGLACLQRRGYGIDRGADAAAAAMTATMTAYA
jgi:hypothetical protein